MTDPATLRGALLRAWALRRPLLLAHLAAALLSAAVLTPMAALSARLAIALSGGGPAAADQAIAALVLSPAGAAGAVVVLSLLLAVNVVEVATMLALDAAERRGDAPSVRAALHRVIRRGHAILHLAAAVVLRLGLRAAPFAMLAAVAVRPLLGAADINYYLAHRPPEFLWAAAFGVVLALGMAATLGERLLAWAFSVPAVVLGGAGGREALTLSATLTRGGRLRLLGLFLGWAVAILALAAAVSAAGALIARATVPGPEPGLDRLALHILLTLATAAAANLVIGAAAAGWFACLLGGLYAQAGGPDATPPGRSSAARRLRLRPALLLAGSAAAVAAAGAATLSRGLWAEEAVAVIANRGAAAARPENTLAAVERAIADGADWIEIDVQETADGHVVVIHDSDFMKLAGVNLKVWDATLAEIEAIDVGAWFGPAFAGERVPTLRAVLEAARGRAGVLIELKHYGRAVRLEERVAEIVEATDMVGRIAVMSLDHPSAARMKALRPDWRVGLLAATAIGDLTRLDADFLAVSTHLATPALMRRARAAGRDVYVWTVNDALAMSQAASLGAAGLITDEPALARTVLDERAGMSAAERLALLAADLFGVSAPQRAMRDRSP